MLNEQYTKEIVQALAVLPDEKVVEAHDFVLFLKDRYSQEATQERPVNRSDFWTEEDLHDFTASSMRYADQVL